MSPKVWAVLKPPAPRLANSKKTTTSKVSVCSSNPRHGLEPRVNIHELVSVKVREYGNFKLLRKDVADGVLFKKASLKRRSCAQQTLSRVSKGVQVSYGVGGRLPCISRDLSGHWSLRLRLLRNTSSMREPDLLVRAALSRVEGRTTAESVRRHESGKPSKEGSVLLQAS